MIEEVINVLKEKVAADTKNWIVPMNWKRKEDKEEQKVEMKVRKEVEEKEVNKRKKLEDNLEDSNLFLASYKENE